MKVLHMKLNQRFLQSCSLVLIASVLAGCATTQNQGLMNNSNNNATTSASKNNDPCNVAGSAIAGAIVGAILGGVTGGKDGAIKGATLGTVAGGILCAVVNTQSTQTRTAQQVEQDYQRARGNLPAKPTVANYTPRLASAVVPKGQAFQVLSTVELVNGRTETVREVREELLIYSPDGQLIKNGSKPFVANNAGRFENRFSVNLGSDAPQGVYPMKTNLVLNGKVVETRDLRTQIVWDGHQATMVAVND